MNQKFDGSSGRKPQTEAKRYVYDALASTLEMDMNGNGATYLFEDLEHEPDRRRAMKAARAILIELQAKAKGTRR